MDRERPEWQLMVKVAFTAMVLSLVIAFGSQAVMALLPNLVKRPIFEYPGLRTERLYVPRLSIPLRHRQ